MGNPSLEETDVKDEQQYIEELTANAEQFALEEKKLVRKIDLYLLPTVRCITYNLNMNRKLTTCKTDMDNVSFVIHGSNQHWQC